MSFREIQNEINLVSKRLGEIKDKLVALYEMRNESAREMNAPRGNVFDRAEYAQITNAIETLDGEQTELENELSWLRYQQSVCAIAAA